MLRPRRPTRVPEVGEDEGRQPPEPRRVPARPRGSPQHRHARRRSILLQVRVGGFDKRFRQRCRRVRWHWYVGVGAPASPNGQPRAVTFDSVTQPNISLPSYATRSSQNLWNVHICSDRALLHDLDVHYMINRVAWSTCLPTWLITYLRIVG
jgi:hypothetical protein